MMTIRREQLAALSELATRDFQRHQISYLSSEYPSRARDLGQAGLQAHVEQAMADATQRGILSKGAVAIWIELRLQFGNDLQRSPERKWALKILAHPALPDHVKLDLVRDRLTAHTGGRPVVPFGTSTSN